VSAGFSDGTSNLTSSGYVLSRERSGGPRRVFKLLKLVVAPLKPAVGQEIVPSQGSTASRNIHPGTNSCTRAVPDDERQAQVKPRCW
jgi:hypothetical protein